MRKHRTDIWLTEHHHFFLSLLLLLFHSLFFNYYLKFPLFLSFYSNTLCSKIVNTIIVNTIFLYDNVFNMCLWVFVYQPKGVCEGISMWCKCVTIWVGWEGRRQYQWWVQLENDLHNFVLWILWISQWRSHPGTNPRSDPHTQQLQWWYGGVGKCS